MQHRGFRSAASLCGSHHECSTGCSARCDPGTAGTIRFPHIHLRLLVGWVERSETHRINGGSEGPTLPLTL